MKSNNTYLSAVKDDHPYITEQIHKLLHEYDCVIVPELGGFVTDYRPAQIDPAVNIIHPPGKELRFNSSLKKNDGLLAHALSSAKKITHEQANTLLKGSVENYFTELNKGEKVVFDKVGVLYLDSHSRMRFRPYQSVNYLLDSYRLKNVNARPVPVMEPVKEAVEEIVAPIIPIETQTSTAAENVQADENESRRYWVAAALIPLFLLSGYLMMNSEAVPAMKHQLSNLSLFEDSMAPVTYVERSGHIELSPDETFEKATLGEELALIEGHSPIPLRDLVEEDRLMLMESESTYVAPVKAPELQYHVVGGCFSEKGNADSYVNTLKTQGFDAYIFDKKGGLHRVVFGSFADRSIALDALVAVKQEYQTDAWLLRKMK